MKTIIKLKFKKSIAIPTPTGILQPNIYPGFTDAPGFGKVPAHFYNFDEVYTLTLPDEEKEIPEHIAKLDPDMRKAFLESYAKELAEHHDANNQYRDALTKLVAEGIIEVISDSFMDKKAPKKPVVEETPVEVKVTPEVEPAAKKSAAKPAKATE